ncbi:PH domain-containing protein [Pleurotus pulmonarius]
MTLFHAYISEINNDTVWRLVLTFSDAAAADEWWRAISSGKTAAGAPANLLSDIRRINPQFYNHNVAVFNVYEFFTDWRVTELAKPFRGRMFITLQNDRGGRGHDIIADQKVTDLVSGDWFYVRSKTDPSLYWHYEVGNSRVVVSNCQRTMFSVVAQNVPAKTVMIRSDTVALSAWPHNRAIRIGSQGNLIGGSTNDWTFDFEDFATGRFVDSDGVVVYENIADNAPKKPGWELVN